MIGEDNKGLSDIEDMMVVTPPNTNPGIKQLWGFFSIDAEGREGICAKMTPDGSWMPLVTAEYHVVAVLIPVAQRITDITGCGVILRRFDNCTDIQSFIPTPSEEKKEEKKE